ncbi:MFS transporter [Aestuariicella hydrocarbonica]|uniref:MFS transporter n=1 Tax=Pseudomaricurvus hydrocarbonicus TaxID=1470433 RepID=A0A9E5JUU4_9GAMM|nr:MFS transporter [Aestuariicella hydrocarbonica]NHO65719.1 MFS transporter [Aestuariicella hydrocarbonica]
MAHYHQDDIPVIDVSRRFAWIVFALTFGLLISDYMSRQVLNAVFPLLKAEWQLSDTQLGSLSGIVALMVGLLTVPLSILADRWGRVKSLTLMALLWSFATLLCGLSDNFGQMFAARFFVGIGEAAYGSVGIALVLSVFPPSLRATLASAFMAGGMFGSVLGMALGGVIAAQLGWRWAFVGMALFGLVLAAIYPFVVCAKRVAPQAQAIRQQRPSLRGLINNRSVLSAYVGSGLQLFVAATLMAWMPSFMNRYYGMGTDQAGLIAGLFVLLMGVGTVLCGMLSDRLCRERAQHKITLAIAYCLLCCLLFSVGFRLQPGMMQLLLLGFGMFLVAGTNGPAGAMVANLTHTAIHGTAFATLTLANNFFGMAPGPFVTGILADWLGLSQALALIPLMSLIAAGVFFYAKRHYQRDAASVRELYNKEVDSSSDSVVSV